MTRGGRRGAIVAMLAGMAISTGAADGFASWPWRHSEPQPRLAGREMFTRTAHGAPGDALNVGLEGGVDEVVCAMRGAGWFPADPVTLRTSLHIAESVIARRAYHTAPVSPLYYQGRQQDLAFQKPAGRSASTRHHVRFWRTLDAGDRGAPLWLGAATFDSRVGFSHRTGQITHHVAPDIDAERAVLIGDLSRSGRVAATYQVSGIGATLVARNGGGDRYFTDGDIVIAKLRAGCVAAGVP